MRKSSVDIQRDKGKDKDKETNKEVGLWDHLQTNNLHQRQAPHPQPTCCWRTWQILQTSPASECNWPLGTRWTSRCSTCRQRTQPSSSSGSRTMSKQPSATFHLRWKYFKINTKSYTSIYTKLFSGPHYVWHLHRQFYFNPGFVSKYGKS